MLQKKLCGSSGLKKKLGKELSKEKAAKTLE
jgi:hypothetical protein